MNLKQIIGLVLLAIGVIMIIYAVQSMNSFTTHEITRKITGRWDRENLSYVGVGALLIIGGAVAAFFYRKKR
ncbi:MAG: DUF3185 family protein [Verrucomicrobiota bacterium]|nr:DUF3185 family protein [Verrucomicrobiota bacterium]